MTTSLYTLTTNYITYLGNIETILQKADAWKDEKKVTDEALCNTRLAIDMFPLARQVQFFSDFAKRSGALIAGVEAPVYEDNEKTIAELIARVQKTKAFLESLPKDTVADGLDTKMVPFVWVPGKGFTAKYYLETYATGNFYFHLVTAYAILRHHGLTIGKMDFLGAIDLKDLA
jgi:hypothetical protein